MLITKVASHRLKDVDSIKSRDINFSFCQHVQSALRKPSGTEGPFLVVKFLFI
jgi:hypothetical protein